MNMEELKILKNSIIKSMKDNVISFIASKEIYDRDNDKVFIDGIETDNFMKNPVFLWGHDMNKKPIGKVIEVKKEVGEDGYKQLVIDVEFWKGEESQEIKEMYQEGFLNSVSIRFIGKDYDPNDKGGYDVKNSELLEVSSVSIPANQGAMMIKMFNQINQMEKKIDKSLNKDVNIEVLNKLESILKRLDDKGITFNETKKEDESDLYELILNLNNKWGKQDGKRK